jgi:hypothetical protein
MVLQDTDLHKTLGMGSKLTLNNKSFWDGTDKGGGEEGVEGTDSPE